MCLLSCGACLSQIILFIFNFLLSLVSLAVTGIGIFALIQVKKLDDEIEYLHNGPVITIVVGCVFSAIFFCGCCGAFIRNKCLLTSYAVVTILLATATVVFTVFVFKGADQLESSSKELLINTFSDPNNEDVLNLLETGLGCCGTTGPDYYNSTSIPMSCCSSILENIQNINQDNININITDITNSTSGDIGISCPISNAYQDGCVDIFIGLLSKIFKVTGQVLIWIIIIQYVAAFLAIFLACYIR